MAERGEIREARIRDGGTVEMKAAEILHRLDGRQPSVRHSRFTKIEPIECGRDGSQRGHLGVAKLVELQPRVGGEPWTVGGKRAHDDPERALDLLRGGEHGGPIRRRCWRYPQLASDQLCDERRGREFLDSFVW